jgi:hypothetical protein
VASITSNSSAFNYLNNNSNNNISNSTSFMTQMNAAVTSLASQNSPQCFSQNSSNGSELASPEDNEESVGSADSVRDRSHLFLDPGSSRGPANFLNGLKRRTNFGPNLFDPPAAPTAPSAAAATTTVATATTNNNNNNNLRNGFATTLTNPPDVSMLSPMLQKDFLQVVNAMMSPANRRPSNFPLTSSSLAQSAFNNLQKSNLLSSIAETPTPTKILYPSQVTEEAQEFAEGFTKVLEKIQQQNQFCATSLASPSTNLLLPLINALTPTNPAPSIVTSAANNANTAALNAIIAALTPTLTPTQTATTEQLFAVALASLATTPTGNNHPSPSTNFPPLPQISQPQQQQFNSATTTTTSGLNQSLSNSSTVATGGNQTASAPIPTTTTTTSSAALTDIYKNLDSGLMDHMFSNHADLNFPGLMSHFGQQQQQQNGGMPTHSQPLSQHNGYHQPGINGGHQGPPQQPGMIPIKSEPNNNGYGNGIGHSLQGSAATGMCQPPPQNLSCAPSTSSHQMATYQSHLSNNLQELELNEQERRKLERKRARNRMAASKCRQRKIERISQLEGEVQQERQRYQSLQNSINSMEKTISMLQSELQRHKHSGCALDKSTLNLMNHLSTIMNNNAAVPMDTR